MNEVFQEKSEKDVIIKTLTSEILDLGARIKQMESLMIVKEDQEM